MIATCCCDIFEGGAKWLSLVAPNKINMVLKFWGWGVIVRLSTPWFRAWTDNYLANAICDFCKSFVQKTKASFYVAINTLFNMAQLKSCYTRSICRNIIKFRNFSTMLSTLPGPRFHLKTIHFYSLVFYICLRKSGTIGSTLTAPMQPICVPPQKLQLRFKTESWQERCGTARRQLISRQFILPP